MGEALQRNGLFVYMDRFLEGNKTSIANYWDQMRHFPWDLFCLLRVSEYGFRVLLLKKLKVITFFWEVDLSRDDDESK